MPIIACRAGTCADDARGLIMRDGAGQRADRPRAEQARRNRVYLVTAVLPTPPVPGHEDRLRAVTTRDQNPAAQHDALASAGCDPVFVDKASGKLAGRPELDKALMVARAPVTSSW